MNPWERHWYVIQVASVASMGEFGGQWMVYGADTADKDTSEGSCLFAYKGPPIAEEDARLAAAAPDLYRALEAALGAADAAIAQHDVSTSTETESYELVRKARDMGDAALKKARGER